MPLLIGDALRWLGVPGSIAIVVVAAVALWHGRSLLGVLSTLGFAAKVVGVVSLVGVAAAVGLIPGVDVSVAIGTFVGWLAGIAAGVGDALGELGVSLEVVP